MLTQLTDIRNRLDRWLVALALREMAAESVSAPKHVSLNRWGPDEPDESLLPAIAPPHPKPMGLDVLQADVHPHSVAPRRLCLDSFPFDSSGSKDALMTTAPPLPHGGAMAGQASEQQELSRPS